jgi:hypothetical protein
MDKLGWPLRIPKHACEQREFAYNQSQTNAKHKTNWLAKQLGECVKFAHTNALELLLFYSYNGGRQIGFMRQNPQWWDGMPDVRKTNAIRFAQLMRLNLNMSNSGLNHLKMKDSMGKTI